MRPKLPNGIRRSPSVLKKLLANLSIDLLALLGLTIFNKGMLDSVSVIFPTGMGQPDNRQVQKIPHPAEVFPFCRCSLRLVRVHTAPATIKGHFIEIVLPQQCGKGNYTIGKEITGIVNRKEITQFF